MEQSLLFKKGTIMRPQHKVFSSSAKEASSSAKEATSSSVKEATSSSAKEATPTKSSKSFVEWYEGHLQYAPVGTKMVTGGILWGIGDAVAQLIPQLAFEENEKDGNNKKETSSLSSLTYDLPRTGRAVFFGFALHAPTSHVHFNFLEWMTVRAGVTGLGIPVFKAVMEQVCIVKAIPYHTLRIMFGSSRLTRCPLVFLCI
jgi:hypothetical protein